MVDIEINSAQQHVDYIIPRAKSDDKKKLLLEASATIKASIMELIDHCVEQRIIQWVDLIAKSQLSTKKSH